MINSLKRQPPNEGKGEGRVVAGTRVLPNAKERKVGGRISAQLVLSVN